MVNFKTFYTLMDQWSNDLQTSAKIESLRNAFMACETSGDISLLIMANSDFMSDNPGTFRFARNARRRIHNIHREALKSWDIRLN